MQVKAVIIRPDRTNDVVIVKKKAMMGKTFRHDNEVYLLHQDRFQVTWTRPNYGLGFIKKYYSTYYYIKGQPQPVPLQDLAKLFTLGENGHGPQVKVINEGVSGEELAALFNPWFYRIIAAQSMTTWDMITMYGVLGACAGILYLIYAVSTGHYAPPGGSP